MKQHPCNQIIIMALILLRPCYTFFGSEEHICQNEKKQKKTEFLLSTLFVINHMLTIHFGLKKMWVIFSGLKQALSNCSITFLLPLLPKCCKRILVSLILYKDLSSKSLISLQIVFI